MDQGLILDDSTGTITDQIEPKKDSQKAFAKDVALIVGGTTIAQVIGILTSPIITRLFGAEAFGLSALFASLVNTIVVISCLRYEFTIMLPKKDEEAINLLAVSLIINTTISFILIPTMWFLGQDIADILNAPNLAQYLWLVPLMVFLTGSFQAINYWNSRKRQFRRLSTAQVSKAASNAGSQILFGYAGLATGGSLIGASIIPHLRPVVRSHQCPFATTADHHPVYLLHYRGGRALLHRPTGPPAPDQLHWAGHR
jgi:lipopolysaccharide exporter